MLRQFVAALGGLALAGCIAAPGEGEMVKELQGTWTGCMNDGALDYREELTFLDRDITWDVLAYDTADGSCGGDPTVSRSLAGSYVVASSIEATVGEDGPVVIARGMDVTAAGRTFYTTVFLDAGGDPAALHLGVPGATPGRDMTSGAKRPIVLSERGLVKQE